MKKLIAILMAALLALSAAAFAETYRCDDLTFEYDEKAIEITHEEHNDDKCYIVMGYKDDAWGLGYISIQLLDLPDGQKYPTREEIAKDVGVEASALEELPTWGNFTDVVTASFTNDDLTETEFIAPVYDDDGEVEDILTVVIATTALEDEDIAMQRDDAISAIVDSLKVID